MKQLFKFLFVFSVVLGCNSNNSRPNVIFILVDDLGWNDLGYSGSAFYETPNIDKLSKESFQFTNAYAASPVCSPTRASIMTGKYPTRFGYEFTPVPATGRLIMNWLANESDEKLRARIDREVASKIPPFIN